MIDARKRSVNKYGAKEPFATKTSDNHTSKTRVTGVDTPVCCHMLRPHMLQLNTHT